MKRSVLALVVLLLLVTVSTSFAQVTAVPQLMNFQGRLAKPDGTPVADGTYSLTLSLWDVASGGTVATNQKWSQTINPVTVRNGVFSVQLSGFPAGTFNINLWLEVKIGSNAALTPRQQLVTVPYAMKSDLALTVPDGSITNLKIAPGTLTADRFAPNIFNPLAWLLGGNSGTNSTHFLGTTDNQPLAFRVNNRRAMRYSYAENATNQYRSINVLGGSEINSIGAGVIGATIAGGGLDFFTGTDYPNQVTADFGTVGGGRNNIASGFYATVVGGSDNLASGQNATVAGGSQNTASGVFATVGGGNGNIASGNYSFAAGFRANANHSGAFVWADISSTTNFASTTANQFNVRAAGGVRIYTKSDLSIGVTLSANDSSWNSVSDRNKKTAFREIDPLDVLAKLVAIPITTWNYKGVENPIRHIGPMAQDFFAAFGVGMDDKHIGTIDADGVALAAIQGLNRKLEASNAAFKKETDTKLKQRDIAIAELKRDNDAKAKRLSDVEAKNAELEARLERLEAALRNQK